MTDAPSLAAHILSKVDLPLPSGLTADLLVLSAQSHREYRHFLTQGRPLEARTALTIAAQTRAQAELQDPPHADPAWGAVPMAVVTDETLHHELLDFYFRELSK